MFCSKCGIKQEEDAKFCHSCGTSLTVIPIDDSKNTEEELSRNKELLLRHLAGDLNPDEIKVVAELLRSNDWAQNFLKEAAENARAPRPDIPDSRKKILQQQKEIKEKRAKIIGLRLTPKSTVKKISQESKENSGIDSDKPQKEEVIDTASQEEQDESRTLELTGKEVEPPHIENIDEGNDGEESVEVVSAEPKATKCSCNNCGQHIEFDDSMVGVEVACPSCGMNTELFLPGVTSPERATSGIKAPTNPPPLISHDNRMLNVLNAIIPKGKKKLIFGLVVSFIFIVLLSIILKIIPRSTIYPSFGHEFELMQHDNLTYGITLKLLSSTKYQADMWSMKSEFSIGLGADLTDSEWRQQNARIFAKNRENRATKRNYFSWTGSLDDSIKFPKKNIFSVITRKAIEWDMQVNKLESQQANKVNIDKVIYPNRDIKLSYNLSDLPISEAKVTYDSRAWVKGVAKLKFHSNKGVLYSANLPQKTWRSLGSKISSKLPEYLKPFNNYENKYIQSANDFRNKMEAEEKLKKSLR